MRYICIYIHLYINNQKFLRILLFCILCFFSVLCVQVFWRVCFLSIIFSYYVPGIHHHIFSKKLLCVLFCFLYIIINKINNLIDPKKILVVWIKSIKKKKTVFALSPNTLNQPNTLFFPNFFIEIVTQLVYFFVKCLG